MSNMSYCKFQNTDHDLRDCEDALENLCAGEGVLTGDELYAARDLVQRCQNIVAMLAEANCIDNDDALDFDIAGALDSVAASAEPADEDC